MMLEISSNNQYDPIQQKKVVSRVIISLFGRDVNTWITDHPATTTEQDGLVGDHTVSIIFTDVFGFTMIVIAPKQ